MIPYVVVETRNSLYHEGGYFKVIDTRNPHVNQHSGFFSTFEKAEKALKLICWGESIEGDAS